MSELVFQRSGKCYHIADLLVCPKCQSRFLSFSYLSVYSHLPDGDLVWSFSGLFAYCFKCKSTFMHHSNYAERWRHLYPTGLVPITNSELREVVTCWFEAQESSQCDFIETLGLESDEEFPF